MRKLIALALTAVAALGATSTLANPGPNGSNNHGLCTAYFRGSETGRENKRKAPPFAELERVSEEAYDAEFGEDNEATIDEKVAWWCGENAPHPGKGGGKSGGNGGGNGGGGGKGKSGR
ncbi:MAG TPA: hypothetical protein VM841_12750 [Actinomycetota bacterium]|nr:hypothetical protein [Actinomycetota bacterium]